MHAGGRPAMERLAGLHVHGSFSDNFDYVLEQCMAMPMSAPARLDNNLYVPISH